MLSTGSRCRGLHLDRSQNEPEGNHTGESGSSGSWSFGPMAMRWRGRSGPTRIAGPTEEEAAQLRDKAPPTTGGTQS